MNRTIGIIGMSAVLLAVMAGIVGAETGVNQYVAGTASPEGLCHGAFANTNGNFSWVSLQPAIGYPNTHSPLVPGTGVGGIGLTGNLNSAAGGC
jgi:hypothetical protein